MSPTPTNAELFARARRVLPGGVSSPVRAFKAVGGSPLFYSSGKGAEFVDAEGRTYLDFVMSWGPLILGHAHEAIVSAVAAAAAKGTSFGAPCVDEVELAELIVDWHPAAEKVRFVSSGTEAVMSAIRVARGATGRDRILKFSGCYHGHSDPLLVAAGSGLATFGKPSSSGVPADFARWTSVLELDDENALEHWFDENGRETAVAVIEPVPANNGLLLQRKEYLNTLRELCTKNGTLLLFDEVISGFRLARGGASEVLGITPDLVTFGKVIGGGMPVGAFGGPAAVMDHLAPDGAVYQAGTLSGNPVAMAAGLACLRTLAATDAWNQLEQLGSYLDDKLGAVIDALPFGYSRIGSIFWLAPDGPAPRSAEVLPSDLGAQYARLHEGLLAQGIYLAPSAYEVAFLSTAHTRSDIDRLVDGLVRAAGDIRA